MELKDYIHPYINKKIHYKFSYWIEDINEYKFSIYRKEKSAEDNTIKAFKLEEIYKTHEDEIKDLVRIKKKFSIRYLFNLEKMLRGQDDDTSIEELYRLAFGTHSNDEEFYRRPLSKMKYDILTELKMIIK